jgi:hypothetical protein
VKKQKLQNKSVIVKPASSNDLFATAQVTKPEIPRAQAPLGGSDFDLDRLVALCPACHAQTDAPYGRGRLVITPVGQGQFTFTVVRGTDKWATRS